MSSSRHPPAISKWLTKDGEALEELKEEEVEGVDEKKRGSWEQVQRSQRLFKN